MRNYRVPRSAGTGNLRPSRGRERKGALNRRSSTVDQLTARIRREKQFNCKPVLHQELTPLQAELKDLS